MLIRYQFFCMHAAIIAYHDISNCLKECRYTEVHDQTLQELINNQKVTKNLMSMQAIAWVNCYHFDNWTNDILYLSEELVLLEQHYHKYDEYTNKAKK